jgi:hypothetical protein
LSGELEETGEGTETRGYSCPVAEIDSQQRLAEAGARARLAERHGDDALANAEWRRYRLIRDARRDPDELLAEGIELCEHAAEFASAGR